MVKEKVKLKYKMPKTVGDAIDLLYKVRLGRQKYAALEQEEKDQEHLIEEKILAMFDKNTLEGAKGKNAQSSIKRSEVPTLKDWNKFEKYLKKTGELDLLQRRLSVDACRERWEAKKAIPGVEAFTVVKLVTTKRK
jgi:hypothetical protein